MIQADLPIQPDRNIGVVWRGKGNGLSGVAPTRPTNNRAKVARRMHRLLNINSSIRTCATACAIRRSFTLSQP